MNQYTKDQAEKAITLYRGTQFSVEWYIGVNGRSDARDFYESLPIAGRVKFLKLVRLISEIGRIYDQTKFRNEGESIYAFKPQPDRFLCFFHSGRKIIVTNGFRKKTQKLPGNEKQKALKAKADFETRINQGTYYEKK